MLSRTTMTLIAALWLVACGAGDEVRIAAEMQLRSHGEIVSYETQPASLLNPPLITLHLVLGIAPDDVTSLYCSAVLPVLQSEYSKAVVVIYDSTGARLDGARTCASPN